MRVLCVAILYFEKVSNSSDILPTTSISKAFIRINQSAQKPQPQGYCALLKGCLCCIQNVDNCNKVDIALKNELTPPLPYFANDYILTFGLYFTRMKFLIESSDKAGIQIKASSLNDNKEEAYTYFNILNPSNKLQCDSCKRDITKSTKIMFAQADFCVSCFSSLEQYPPEYRVINKLDYPLFDQDWTAEEQLLLFEGLQKHGFGNWGEIGDFIGSNKSREDVEQHYQIYLTGQNFVPPENLLTRRDQHGMLIHKESSAKRQPKPENKVVANKSVHFRTLFEKLDRASLTVNQTNKTGNNPAQIIGFMPKRGDFQVQYDNDAQLLLAEMEFNDQDTQEEKAMKFRLIDIYNHKLNERIKRKEFVVSRKLLDLREQIRLDKTRTKEEKQIYNMMKVFSRFNSADQHQKLVQGIIKEKEIRQRIEELKELKKKGFKTLGEIEDQLQNKKKKDEKTKKRQTNDSYDKTRRVRKDTNQKPDKRVPFVNHQQQELCKKLNMTFKQYMVMKQTIIRQSVRVGVMSRQESSQLFKVDASISQAVFDFLVQHQDIIMRNPADIQVSQ